MDLKSYLNNKYIGLIDKKDSTSKCNEQVDKLLNEINVLLYRCTNKRNLKFGLVSEYKSPTNQLEDVNDDKKEKVTRRWMKINEILEEIKEKHVDKL